MIRKNLISTFLVLIIATGSLFSQISENQLQKIDEIFTEWTSENHPGGSIGIMKDGEIILEKAYGLASLEYAVPNTPSTLYNIASVSKEFTAMGIVLLENQGKLSYDDDIRKYLPHIPEFEKPITIRHMLHHTSGMRSFHPILQMAGWGAGDRRRNEDIHRIMKHQQDLNFTPNDEYLYCNNGYMFMANIIEQVTGEKFIDWMQENIFIPLGMENSYCEEQYNRVVSNNATSYRGQTGKEFKRVVEYWDYVGSGNMHSNIYDLLKWLQNFHDPKPGWEKAFSDLQTRGVLNSGDTITYAFGVRVEKYHGMKKVGHSGSIGGFKSIVSSFPNEKINIVILSNFSTAYVKQKLDDVCKVIFDIQDPEPQPEAKTIRLSAKKLEKFAGHYWNSKEVNSREIYLKNDTLRYKRSEKDESNLLPVSANTFLMNNASSNVKVEFNNNQMLVYSGNDTTILESYTLPELTTEDLKAYTGQYYSPELKIIYIIDLIDDKLLAYNMKLGDLKLKLIRENHLTVNVLGKLKIERDTEGNIIGFYATKSRAWNVWFKKLENEL